MDILVLLVAPLITGLVCLTVRRRSWTEWANAIGATVMTGAGGTLAGRAFVDGAISEFGDLVYVDSLGALLIVVITLVGFLAAIYSISYIRSDVLHEKIHIRQVSWYYLRFHLFLWTMLVTVVVNNLGLLWVAIEATTLVSALLVGTYRTKAALEAAWKYLIICTVGITFALFGVLLTYYASVQALGEEAGLNWAVLISHAGELDPSLMKLAFVFVLIGFGTKAGLVPLHTWLPDAHSQAPSPVSAVLSGVLLNCGLYGILRFHMITSGAVGYEFSSRLLLYFGLMSVVVAVLFILVQRDFKRFLAYSSVEHIGLITLAFGIGGSLGVYAGLLHLVNHALAKALLFFVAGNLSQCYGTTKIARIRAAIETIPITGTLFFVGMIAIMGIPPFGMFVSEFAIVGAGFAEGNYLVAVILVLALAVVFTGAFAYTLRMAFGRQRSRSSPIHTGPGGLIAMAVPTTIIILFGIYIPPPMNQFVQQVVILFGGGALQ